MNIRIAVCDDETEVCSLMEMMLIDIFKNKGVQCKIESFISGEELWRNFQGESYDLVFLDIEMEGSSGIDVGRYIREELGNETVQIAYISAKTEYAMELFEFRPLNFLVKPIERSRVEKLIDKFFLITGQEELVFEYTKKADHYKIPLKEILYFESEKRKIHIHFLEGRDEFYGSMEEIYQRLKAHKFLYIHRSIVINYRYIKKMTYESIIMFNGVELPISQPRRSEIKRMCMKIRKGEGKS